MGLVRPLYFFAALTFFTIPDPNLRAGDPLSTAGPKLRVETPSIDLGFQSRRHPLHHVFHFSNAGDEPLSVNVANRSCRCIGGELSATLLPPGAMGEFALTLESPEGKALQEEYKVLLATNDPAQPEALLELSVQWADPVSAIPASLRFDPTKAAYKIEVISIAERDENGAIVPPARIIKVSGTPSSIRATKSSEVNKNGYLRSELKIELPAALAARDPKIVIETDSKVMPIIEVPILMDVPALVLSQSAISFGVLKDSTPVTKNIEISSKTPLGKLRAESSDPRVAARLEENSAKSWKLHAVLNPNELTGRLKATISLLDDAGAKVAEIPVLATALRAK